MIDDHGQFFRSQIQQFYDNRNEKGERFEKLQQHEREKVAQFGAIVSSGEGRRRVEEFIKLQDKEMEEFVIKRERLIKAHEEKVSELRRRLLYKEMELEKEFDSELSKLMDEYNTKQQSCNS